MKRVEGAGAAVTAAPVAETRSPEADVDAADGAISAASDDAAAHAAADAPEGNRSSESEVTP